MSDVLCRPDSTLQALSPNEAVLAPPVPPASDRPARPARPLPNVIPPSWHDPDYRRASMEAHVEQAIAWQIRVNRDERGLSQADLAKRMSTQQSAVSRLEDPDGRGVRLSTLMKVAHAFDCALLVRLVPYSEFAAVSGDVRPERLHVATFETETDDSGQASLDFD